MKNYYSVMLGRQSMYSAPLFAEGFIGIEDDMVPPPKKEPITC